MASKPKRRVRTKHIVSKERYNRETTYFDKPKYYGDRLKDGFDAVNHDIW